MKPLHADLFVFIFFVALILAGFIVFWSIMDMVLLGASLAAILIPVHHRISRYTLPEISAAVVTFAVLFATAIIAGITLLIVSSNVNVLTDMFGTVGTWLNDPATNPLDYGIPISKSNLSSFLAEGTALFVDYQKTLISNLYLILFKMLVLFVSLFSLIRWGEELKMKFTRHVPDVLTGYIRKLSEVTLDTLYVIYYVQIAIAVLTFFIALPVFYLLGYGNIIFYSFLTAFCELIPVLGSSVAFFLVGTYALALGDTRGVFIIFFLGYIIVSCVPEIYARPVLVGRRVKIHPVIMFIGIISGILTMGLAGFVLGPLIIVLIITSYRMYVQERKERGEPSSLSQT
ncbi:MAG: AI-2E family transporter [Methanoregula sp.]|nr:AI-2E family transporter [Methanoregula sp.]